ncbi:hypothetical protein ACLOJK_038344, partial [Asimina triloba]
CTNHNTPLEHQCMVLHHLPKELPWPPIASNPNPSAMVDNSRKPEPIQDPVTSSNARACRSRSHPSIQAAAKARPPERVAHQISTLPISMAPCRSVVHHSINHLASNGTHLLNSSIILPIGRHDQPVV